MGPVAMRASQLHYLPLSPTIYFLLVALVVVLVVLIQVRLLRYTYERLGLNPPVVLLLLLGSLLGSAINIPVAELPGQPIVSGREINYFGMRYVIPTVVDWPGTVIAINVGGALIPSLTSFYLLAKQRLWGPGLVAIGCVAAVCYWLAEPVRGLGIALPVLAPSLAAAVVSLLLSRGQAAPLAYISGSLGTLLGADLLNLDKISGIGAPVASIGGAGTFDGVFLVGVMAVLIASLWPGTSTRPSPA
jgi:uncharacterized membrane protein